jgi:hypothetical protein
MGRLVGIVVVAVAAQAFAACGGDTTTVVNNTTTVTSEVATTTDNAAQTEESAEDAVMMNYGSQEFAEPAEFSFSVNGDLVANDLTWENWGGDTAEGSGRFAFRDYPSTRRVEVSGTIAVSGLSECNGKSYYTRTTFSFDSKPPFEPEVALPTPCD